MNDQYHSLNLMTETHALGQNIIDTMQSMSPWVTSYSRNQLEEINYGMIFLKAKFEKLQKESNQTSSTLQHYKEDAEKYNNVVKLVNDQKMKSSINNSSFTPINLNNPYSSLSNLGSSELKIANDIINSLPAFSPIHTTSDNPNINLKNNWGGS